MKKDYLFLVCSYLPFGQLSLDPNSEIAFKRFCLSSCCEGALQWQHSGAQKFWTGPAIHCPFKSL
jgi:hypothetical protein